MTRARIVLAVVGVLALAGCGGGGGSADGGLGSSSQDLWLLDDVDLNAVVLEGAVEGESVLGFTCDLAGGFTAFSPGDPVYPETYASVTVTPSGSSIDYTDAERSLVASGSTTPPTGIPATFEVTTDEGTNTGVVEEYYSWTANVTLTVTEVPVPFDACSASHVFGEGLIRDNATAAEVIAAFTEIGLRDVSAECPDASFTWTPPDMSCEEFAPLAW